MDVTTGPAADNMSNISVSSGAQHTGRDLTLQQILVPFTFGVIFLVGVLGNGTLVYIVLRHRKLRNTPNIFIVSLAVGDLLLLLVSVPFSATVFTFVIWPYGQAVCKLNEFLQTLSLGVSVFTLTALAGDRYTAIMYPMKKHNADAQKTVFTAAAIWVLSLLLAIPDAVASRTETNPNYTDIVYCTPHPTEWGYGYVRAHILTRFLLFYLIPLCVIGVLYTLMAHMLMTSLSQMPGEGHAQRQLQARKKVARLVLSLVLVFALCWFPRHLYLMWYAFGDMHFTMFWLLTKIVGFCMAFVNSSINPLALYFLSKQFQRYYNRYLCCCCCCCGYFGCCDECPCADAECRYWSRKGQPAADVEVSQTGTMYSFNSHRHHHRRNKTRTSSVTLLTTHGV